MELVDRWRRKSAGSEAGCVQARETVALSLSKVCSCQVAHPSYCCISFSSIFPKEGPARRSRALLYFRGKNMGTERAHDHQPSVITTKQNKSLRATGNVRVVEESLSVPES